MKTNREEKSRTKNDGVSKLPEARLEISRNGENESTPPVRPARAGMRTLTVSSLYRQWGAAHRKNECCVPSIRLNGKWLAVLGLAPGQKIRVVTNGSIITIAPVAFDREIAHYTQNEDPQI
jgi:Toxin SymE, type I toxin-antitoxin system